MAFESAEELYGVLSQAGNARKAQKSAMMLNYYDKISQVFWVSVRPPLLLLPHSLPYPCYVPNSLVGSVWIPGVCVCVGVWVCGCA